MKALFLTPQFPYPPNKGTSLRNYNLIRHMATRHDIHLLTFVEDREQTTGDNPMQSLCTAIHAVLAPPKRSRLGRLHSTLLSSLPDMALRLRSTAFSQRLGLLLERDTFDIVMVEGIEMAPYIDVVLGASRRPAAIIFDEHNAEYLLQRRAFTTDLRSMAKWPAAFYSLVQWQKLRPYERRACQQATAMAAVSESDRKAILSLDPALKVMVVSNGIDVDFFQAGGKSDGRPIHAVPPVGASFRRRTPLLVFVGTMDYRPNVDAMVWFCREVLPLVRREIPAAQLQIVGRNPTAAVRKAAGENVEIVGGVDDVRPYICGADVYVVPMRIGGGVRFKVLEAMACGVPVVSTGMGAEGIEVVDGEHLLLAEESADFAAKVLRLLGDKPLARALTEKARERAISLYDWRLIAPKLEELWQKCAREGA
ncbi:MAG: glycosyltransferase [Chloroflexi bacterium]|nr:glycosyltransferase [Chloroflexota bacterium]